MPLSSFCNNASYVYVMLGLSYAIPELSFGISELCSVWVMFKSFHVGFKLWYGLLLDFSYGYFSYVSYAMSEFNFSMSGLSFVELSYV